MLRLSPLLIVLITAGSVAFGEPAKTATRPRARDLGIQIGTYAPGPLNSITDVPGVRVGHATLVEGANVRTGVTAILPHGRNLYREKVAAAIYVYNAFGKLVGSTQVQELGQLETPIVLTNTLSVWDAAAAVASWTLERAGNENVRSLNPVVGETNDGWLNDIRGRHVKEADVRRAIDSAADGAIEEGSVGAGTGTVAFGWKGGIGASSRRLAIDGRAFTVGVLVQSNFGGTLAIDGAPIWRTLQPPEVREFGAQPPAVDKSKSGDGSCMIVVATDAPLDARQLKRLAARAIFGMARTGSSGSHGSGDFVIAFSTSNNSIGDANAPSPPLLREDSLTPLLASVIEATEEAILNSLLRATTVTGRDGHIAHAIPIDELRKRLPSASRR